jgi:hypothetical protein
MLNLVAKTSHVGVDVDGLAYSLHHPMACGWQTRGLCCLIGIVLSHHSAVVWIFDVVLTVQVHVRPNLIWRSSPLPGCAYSTSESS